MELKYSNINPSMESATMYIKGTIGVDTKGIEFANEFRYLTNKLGIKDIQIRINSGGGSVVAGYDIVDVILDKDSSIKVTTVIAGLAASMAGVIAMAGDKVIMLDMGLFMIHSANGTKDKNIINKFNHTLVNIFKNRSKVSKEKLNELMKGETFYTSTEALKAGFIDEELEVKKKNKIDVNAFASFEEIVNEYKKINIDIMEDNNDKVEISVEKLVDEVSVLNDSSKEDLNKMVKDALVNAVKDVELTLGTEEENVTEEVENVVEETPEDVEKPAYEKPSYINGIIEDTTVDIEELQNTITNFTNQIVDLKNELEEAKKLNAELIEKENTRLKEEKETKKLAVVNAAIEAGKINDDIKDTWMNLLDIDFDGSKKALESIVTNKSSVDILNIANQVSKIELPKNKSLRELEKENPAEVERILNETPEVFKAMYKEQYGEYPSI